VFGYELIRFLERAGFFSKTPRKELMWGKHILISHGHRSIFHRSRM